MTRWLSLFLILTLPACLERREVITVSASRAAIEYTVKGDPEDVTSGAAAMPSTPAWTVASSDVTEGDSVRRVLKATGTFPLAKLPDRLSDDPHGLRFPTTISSHREGRRTYHLFTRTYRPRLWAPYGQLESRCFPDEIQAKINDLSKQPREGRHQVFRAFLEYERQKNQAFLAAALATLDADRLAASRGLLAGRAALDAHFRTHLSAKTVEDWLALPKAELTAKSDALQAAIDAAALDAASAHVGPRAKLAAALRSVRRAHDVTNDLGDESFEVRLTLPGELVRHNGDKVDGGAVVWRFSGKELRDHPRRLVALSVE